MPSHFHRPDEFLPSRWLDEKCEDVKDASQPFSSGPRGCIGRKYVSLFRLSLLHFPLFALKTRYVADEEPSSFAHVESSLTLAKMHFLYDLHLVDPALDWEGQSEIYVQWWKPALKIRIEKAAK